MTRRRGVSTIGCLFTILVLATIGYFGLQIGRVYWRYYQFEDEMRQEIRFASQRSNEQILATLRASADSLGLPVEAKRIRIQRTEQEIEVDAEYTETVELPMTVREFVFRPRATGPLF